LCSDLGG